VAGGDDGGGRDAEERVGCYSRHGRISVENVTVAHSAKYESFLPKTLRKSYNVCGVPTKQNSVTDFHVSPSQEGITVIYTNQPTLSNHDMGIMPFKVTLY